MGDSPSWTSPVGVLPTVCSYSSSAAAQVPFRRVQCFRNSLLQHGILTGLQSWQQTWFCVGPLHGATDSARSQFQHRLPRLQPPSGIHLLQHGILHRGIPDALWTSTGCRSTAAPHQAAPWAAPWAALAPGATSSPRALTFLPASLTCSPGYAASIVQVFFPHFPLFKRHYHHDRWAKSQPEADLSWLAPVLSDMGEASGIFSQLILWFFRRWKYTEMLLFYTWGRVSCPNTSSDSTSPRSHYFLQYWNSERAEKLL